MPEGEGAIRFENVSFSYLPGRPVLESLDLALDAGTTVALIGHTGSGKTTLSSLVPRFYDVDSGRVLVDGVDVRDLRLASLRRDREMVGTAREVAFEIVDGTGGITEQPGVVDELRLFVGDEEADFLLKG
jgi:ABC-type bacteriocin/lantibiotic exporter with double-glycine peptidase domain